MPLVSTVIRFKKSKYEGFRREKDKSYACPLFNKKKKTVSSFIYDVIPNIKPSRNSAYIEPPPSQHNFSVLFQQNTDNTTLNDHKEPGFQYVQYFDYLSRSKIPGGDVQLVCVAIEYMPVETFYKDLQLIKRDIYYTKENTLCGQNRFFQIKICFNRK